MVDNRIMVMTEYWVAKRIDGEQVLLFRNPSLKKAMGFATRWKRKGYYVLIKKRYATRKQIQDRR